jgi:hypothetical protein
VGVVLGDALNSKLRHSRAAAPSPAPAHPLAGPRTAERAGSHRSDSHAAPAGAKQAPPPCVLDTAHARRAATLAVRVCARLQRGQVAVRLRL